MDYKKGKFKVKDLKLAKDGQLLIEWAESRMPVLAALREKYSKTKPFKGYRIAGCLHVTKETAVLVKTFVDAGAEVSWSGCNPLSTNDSVAAALAREGVLIFAWHGMSVKDFYWCIEETLKIYPNLTLDDGADLIFTIHNKHPEYA
ncbi:MAG: adenosylhomocysteinase, partial [Bacteroidetes bacterium]|nr:adenosylhomocysteinase [Bacteroidota bacterium]